VRLGGNDKGTSSSGGVAVRRHVEDKGFKEGESVCVYKQVVFVSLLKHTDYGGVRSQCGARVGSFPDREL
jgi:hypothetical protein